MAQPTISRLARSLSPVLEGRQVQKSLVSCDLRKILSAKSGGHSALERSMSLRPEPVGAMPAETVRVARAAFPKGTLVTRLRDEFSALYQDEDFHSIYPARGHPGLAPWRLALVTVFQFLEHLSD